MADQPELGLESASGEEPLARDQHLRGSALLLVGRAVNIGLDLTAQVMIVRYLSTSDYGAFAYALSVVAFVSSFATLGLDKTVGRFIPMYDEQRDYDRLFGMWLLVSAIVVAAGVLLLVLVHGLQFILAGTLVSDPVALTLLLVLILTTPINALGAISRQLAATFASPWLLLVRNYLVGPTLQLGVVVLVVTAHSTVTVFAIGYVAAAAVSSFVALALVVSVLRRQGLLTHLRFDHLRFPTAEAFGFALPLFASGILLQLRITVTVVLLEMQRSTADVALLRAALPIARQNMVLLETMQILFIPLAARLFARRDRRGLDDLYWSSATFIAVFTFPLFLLSFSLAGPVTVLFYGDRYLAAAPVLAVLALGHYVNAALGFNGVVLRIVGQVRYLVAVDVVSTAAGLLLASLLIERLGSLGAAIGITSVFLVQNALLHAGLAIRAGVDVLRREYLPVYVAIALFPVLLLVVQTTAHPPISISLGLAAAASIAILVVARRSLRIGQAFPELRNIRVLRWLLGD